MKGDVKGLVPCSDVVAVYAREGDDWTLGTEPVLFWAWTETGARAEFVGVVSLGPHLITADDPMLLGYAKTDEDIAVKFRKALEAFKGAGGGAGDVEALREKLAETIRETPAPPANPAPDETFPCPECEKGFNPDGGECETCGGAGVLSADDIEIVDAGEDDPDRAN